MDTKSSNFSVESKGYCFLCLNKISSQFTPTGRQDDTSPCSVYCLQEISRYLKIDMGKVFIQGGPVPSHLLAKVKRSRLKVELCEECASMTENISKQCRQLAKLKMEIDSGLVSIQRKMFEANETGRAEGFRRGAGSQLISGLGGWMEILEVLRMETKQKCSRKINKSTPRLPIRKLSTNEIYLRTLRNPKQETDTTSEQMSDSGLPSTSIKMEEPVGINFPLEDDNHSDSLLVGDLEDDANDLISPEVNNGAERKRGPTNEINLLKRKYIINSETGKYECQLCSKEYSARGSFHLHYNSAHRMIRIKCKICGKEFTQRCAYTVHHRSVHLGVRFQCKRCKKIFSEKSNLRRHQRITNCGLGSG